MALTVEVVDVARDVWFLTGTFRCGHQVRQEHRGFGFDFDAAAAQKRYDEKPGVCYHCQANRSRQAGHSGDCDDICQANGSHPYDSSR